MSKTVPENRQLYIKNLTCSYLPFLSQILVTIVITPYAVHRLGEFEYGVLVLFNTFLGYLALAHIGTPQTLIRRVIDFADRSARDQVDTLISTMLCLYASMIVLVGTLVVLPVATNTFGVSESLVGGGSGLDLLKKLAWPLYLVFAFDLCRQLFDSLIIAANRIYLSKALLAVLIAARGLAIYLVLAGGGGVYEVLLAFALLSALFALIFGLLAYRQQRFRLSLRRCRLSQLRDIMPDSFWYFLGGISVVLILQTDSLVISAFLNVATVTVYALMFRYVDIVGRMLGNIVMVLFPQAARMFSAADYRGLLRLHDRLLLILIPLGLLAFGLFYLLGEPVFRLWMGDLKLFDSRLFVVFLITNCLLLISSPATNFIEAVGWHRFSTKLSLVQGILNLTLSILLVRSYGTLGVALGTLIALAGTNFWANIIYFRRRLRMMIEES